MPQKSQSYPGQPHQKGIEVFYASKAVPLADSGAMSYDQVAPETLQKLTDALGTEHGDGAESLTVFQGGGVSLVKVWFKSGYPLARHSHDSACLYYILAGSLQLGNEVLAAGDGLFIRPDVLYTYTAGPLGVELLEFRASEEFDIKVPDSSEAYWNMLRNRMFSAHNGKWLGERRPSERALE